LIEAALQRRENRKKVKFRMDLRCLKTRDALQILIAHFRIIFMVLVGFYQMGALAS